MKLFIYCAGNLGKEVHDLATRLNRDSRRWENIEFVNTDFNGYEYYNSKLNKYIDILDLDRGKVQFVIANGEPFIREKLYLELKKDGFMLATLIDETSTISDTATIGEGAIIANYVYVSSNAIIEENVLVQPKSNIGHDCVLKNHSVVSAFTSLGGSCQIGERTYVGMSVSIKEQLSIGNDSIIGMGSSVHHNMPDCVIALGNPARPMKKNIEKTVFRKIKKEVIIE